MVGLRNNRYIILLASVFLQFCYGIAYVWSVFQPFVKKRFGLDNAAANMPFAILLALFSIGNVIGGLLQKRIRPIYLVLGGNIMLTMGIFLSSRVPIESAYLLNITYGVLGGLGAGIAYNTTVATVQKWFPSQRGLVTGILICSTGSFGLIMNPIAQKFLGLYGFEKGTMLVAGIMTIALVIGTGFINEPKERPKDNGLHLQHRDEYDYTINQVLRMPQYFIITLSMMLAVLGYFLINPMLMSLGAERGLSENSALVGVMIVAVMNTAGRLLAPWVSDRLGRKTILIVLFSINMIAILAVSFLEGYQFMLAISAVGFTYGGFMGMYPTITADYFGPRNNGINYGAVLMGYGISSLTCPYLVRAVQGTSMGASLSLIIAAGASILGIVLMLILKKPKEQMISQVVV